MRPMRTMMAAASAACLLAAPAAALAWSNQGHMITGAVAYDDLAAKDGALVAQVEQIMAAHPDKARFEAGLKGLAGEARSRRLFELMARWPDDARGGPYDHPAWHYWLRIVPSTADPAKAPPALMAMTTGEAAEAYRLSLATVRDAYATPADRAVALCWMFHLAGDIQQPLHAAHLISGRFPMTDQAGSIDFVRGAASAAPMGLHEYWDDAIGGDNDDDANVEAQRLRLEADWPRAKFAELNGTADAAAFRGWADESLDLARTTTYAGGTFEGAAKPADAPVLSADYVATVKSLGSRRVALGGHRIADGVRAALGH